MRESYRAEPRRPCPCAGTTCTIGLRSSTPRRRVGGSSRWEKKKAALGRNSHRDNKPSSFTCFRSRAGSRIPSYLRDAEPRRCLDAQTRVFHPLIESALRSSLLSPSSVSCWMVGFHEVVIPRKVTASSSRKAELQWDKPTFNP